MRNSFRGALGDLSRSVLGAQDLRGIPARCRDGGGPKLDGSFLWTGAGSVLPGGRGSLRRWGRGELPRLLTNQKLFRDASQPASGRRIRLFLLMQIRQEGKKRGTRPENKQKKGSAAGLTLLTKNANLFSSLQRFCQYV